MKHLLLLLALALTATLSVAQTRKVSGTITDASGNPLPGVAVLVPGTTIGTVTDADGKYTLSVEGQPKLEASFIGMIPAEIDLAAGQTNATLREEDKEMDEVVVVAYGSTRREAKTGAITTVKADDIADVPASSFDKMLSGKLAGVMITSDSGQPGAATSIRIRGNSSINAGNSPLYVIDGVPALTGNYNSMTYNGNVLSMINPDDIESITVLKDAAATSVYGSRAANGVIIVTTKSGREGKSTVTARAKFGFSQLANDNDFGAMNAHDLLEYQRDAAKNAGYDPDDPTSSFYRPYTLLEGELTNWMDHLTRKGKLQDYEITAQGGSSRTTYYASANFHKNTGIFYGVDFTKLSLRLNADHKINKYFTSGAHIAAGYSKMNDRPTDAFYYSNPAFAGLTILPWTKPYNEDGSHNVDIPENSNVNPRADAEWDEEWEKNYRFNGNLYLQAEPIEGLVIKTLNGAEYIIGDGRDYRSPETNQGQADLYTARTIVSYLQTSNTISYERNFGKNYGKLLLGQEASKNVSDYVYVYSYDVDPQIPYISTATQANDQGVYYLYRTTMLSFFGILDYNYDSRYYLTASFRRDGSSRFGSDKRWGSFWSVGASWNISSESFMENLDWLSFLKVRASYGINGNDNISDYQAFGTYATVSHNGVTGMRTSNPANPDLSWETNKSFNAGIDVTFLQKYTLNFDIYKRVTDDMLLAKPVSQTSGYSSNTMNIGSMENKGLEFQLQANIFRTRDLTWNVGANIAFNRSEITDLAGQSEMASSYGSIRHILGKSLYTFRVRDYYGVNPSNGEALWVTEDGSLSNDYNNARYIYCGSPEPKFTGGANTDITWKGITLSAQFEFKGGNKVFITDKYYIDSDGAYMNMNQLKSAANYWKKPGDTNCNPKPMANNATGSYYVSSRRIEDGSYTRLKDVTLSYTLPTSIVSKAKLGSVRVYVSGQNVYTWHHVDWWDPEFGVVGLSEGSYPMSKTFVAGIDLSF